MKSYIMKFEAVKLGLFSNDRYNRSEVIQSTSLENAYKEQITRAERINLLEDFIKISVTDIQEI